MSAHPDRQDTINRAVALIDSASPADLAGYLARTRIHARLRADVPALRGLLASADVNDSTGAFGAWKAAQQILQTAGLPH
jgi:hypothetical protein